MRVKGLRRKKHTYIAHDLGSPDFEFPTGRRTRFMGTLELARGEAKRLGYELYSIEPMCICLLYRSKLKRLSQNKLRNILPIIRLTFWGAVRYMQHKRSE